MATNQTANQMILDEYIKHQTYLLRYADGLGAELSNILELSNDQLNDTILNFVAKNETAGKSNKVWLKEFGESLADTRAVAWDSVADEMTEQMKALALTEAQTGALLLQAAVPVALGLRIPPTSHLTAIVHSSPFEGKLLKEWLDKAKRSDTELITTNVKAGIIQGKTPAQITRSIMGSQDLDYEDGVAIKKARRELKALVRTITNGIQHEAKQLLYDENSDIIKNELFVATLDGGTTLTCAANDGKIYARNEGPMPPLHFGCRSLRVPYINGDNLGDRGFDPSTESTLLKEFAKQNNMDAVSRDRLPRGQKGKFDAFARKRRRELIGQVPALTNYNDWLKKQSADFQDEVLGKTKGELFRKGGISLDKFVDRKGATLTLAQLKVKGLLPDDKANK